MIGHSLGRMDYNGHSLGRMDLDVWHQVCGRGGVGWGQTLTDAPSARYAAFVPDILLFQPTSSVR